MGPASLTGESVGGLSVCQALSGRGGRSVSLTTAVLSQSRFLSPVCQWEKWGLRIYVSPSAHNWQVRSQHLCLGSLTPKPKGFLPLWDCLPGPSRRWLGRLSWSTKVPLVLWHFCQSPAWTCTYSSAFDPSIQGFFASISCFTQALSSQSLTHTPPWWLTRQKPRVLLTDLPVCPRFVATEKKCY